MSIPQRALVTGATAGIGRAIALELARNGFEVIVHGRDAGRGAEVVREIEAVGGHARFVAADLANVANVERVAAEAGDVDVLVNNTGFSWFGPTPELPVATFDALFATNVRAAYYLVAAVAPKMVSRGSGRIINIASVVAKVGLAGSAAYSATKAALEALTRSWAAELSPRGVLVNAVAPGPVLTSAGARERLTALGKTTLLGRAAEADEIAGLVGFLASPRASNLTGAVLAVDGGRGAI